MERKKKCLNKKQEDNSSDIVEISNTSNASTLSNETETNTVSNTGRRRRNFSISTDNITYINTGTPVNETEFNFFSTSRRRRGIIPFLFENIMHNNTGTSVSEPEINIGTNTGITRNISSSADNIISSNSNTLSNETENNTHSNARRRNISSLTENIISRFVRPVNIMNHNLFSMFLSPTARSTDANIHTDNESNPQNNIENNTNTNESVSDNTNWTSLGRFQFTILVPNSNQETVYDVYIDYDSSTLAANAYSIFLEYFKKIFCTLSQKDIEKIKKYKYEDKGCNNECTVCMESLIEDEMVSELNCNHLFHSKCIDQWLLNYNDKCPVCRSDAVGNGEAVVNKL